MRRAILHKAGYGGITIWSEPDAEHDWFNYYPYWNEAVYYQDLR